MEILAPTTLRIALDVAFVLTAMSALVLAVIIGVRLAAETEVRRAQIFRREAEPLVTAYLAGREKADQAADVLQRNPVHGLSLLMQISDRLEPGERTPLNALFVSLPIRQKEARALRSRQWQKRLRAAERLGYLGDGGSTSALVDTLQDPVLAVRFAAARSLARLGESRCVGPILLAFDLPGEMNQRRVAETLQAFGPAAVAPLLDVLVNVHGTYSDNAIGLAARVLGMLRAAEAAEPLSALLGHSDFRVRLNAVRALGLAGAHGAADDVAKLVSDPAWEVRNAAVQSLGRLRAVHHLALMTSALRDASWWVRFSAAQALWNSGEPGRRALAEAMTGDPDRFARDISRQILEEHGAPEAREARA
jgi:HEAT repeat protein